MSTNNSATHDSESSQPLSARLREGYLTGSERRAEILFAGTGPFRTVLEQYMCEVAPAIYRPGYLTQVRCSLSIFLRYAATELGLQELDLIRPSTITGYIKWRRQHGYRSGNFLGHIASFFSWLAFIGQYDRGNPVIHRFHRELMKNSDSGDNHPAGGQASSAKKIPGDCKENE